MPNYIGDCFSFSVFAKNSSPCNFRLLQQNRPQGDIPALSQPLSAAILLLVRACHLTMTQVTKQNIFRFGRLWRRLREAGLFVAYSLMALIALLLTTIDLVLLETKLVEGLSAARQIQDAQELYARWRWGFETGDFSPQRDDDDIEISARRR